MNKYLILSLITLVISICIYFSRDGSYTWTIKFYISEEKLSHISHMFEQNEYFNFHPLCTSNKLIKDDKSHKQYEITEEIKLLGILPLKIVSQMFYKKVGQNHYSYDVPFKTFFIDVNFYAEYILNPMANGRVEVKEYVKISGPLFSTFIIGKIAFPQHVEMNKKIEHLGN
jgi:hypothetical protein